MNVCVCGGGTPTNMYIAWETVSYYVVSILRECWTTSRAVEPSMKLTLNGQVRVRVRVRRGFNS